MSLYDYYYRYLKTKDEFKYVKTFKDLMKTCKINLVIKIIFFSFLSFIYLSHSIDTFFSGLNIPMITKKKGSILYNSNHKLFNSLHDFTISSGYPIHKGFLEEKANTGRDVLVFKYLTETIIYEDVNITNKNTTLNNTRLNNDTKLNNSDSYNNDTKINTTKTKKAKKKKEWKSMQFKHQLNEKGNNNLHFFISILFRQPRLEYALHHLAYENNGIKNFSEKIWIPHLLYKIFSEKQKEENITKIKIDKIRYTFSRYSDDHFRTNFISRYLDDTNLTIIEEYLKKYNSFMVRDSNPNFFRKIPFAMIMYTLILILSLSKIINLIPLEDNGKENEKNIEINKEEEKDDKDKIEEKENENK